MSTKLFHLVAGLRLSQRGCWGLLTSILALLSLRFFLPEGPSTPAQTSGSQGQSVSASMPGTGSTSGSRPLGPTSAVGSQEADGANVSGAPTEGGSILAKTRVAPTSPSQSGASESKKASLARWQLGGGWGTEPEPALLAFSSWTTRYLAAAAEQREALEGEGSELARQRRGVLAGLISRDPQAALASAVPWSVRQQLPLSVTEHLEERVSGRGDFLVLASVPREDTPGGSPAILREVRIGSKRFTAHVFGARKNQRTTRDISLHGVALDGQLALSESPVRILEPGEPLGWARHEPEPVCSVSGVRAGSATGTAMMNGALMAASGDQVRWLCRGGHLEVLEQQVNAAEGGSGTGSASVVAPGYETLGSRKILLMRVDFSDVPGGPVSQAEAQASLDDVTSFLQANAFNQIDFAVKHVTPVMRMPRTAYSYVTGDSAYDLLMDARNAAAAAGFSASNYEFDIVAFASIGFPWGGLGYVGWKGSWVQGGLHRGVTAHELGHNFGNWHANAWVSGTVTGVDGEHREYGNPFDVLGYASNYPRNHFSANFKFLNGWLPNTHLHTVTASGTYRIFAHDLGGSLKPARKYGIRIPVGISAGSETMDYWLDFRQGFTGNAATANGAVLKWGNDSGTPSASRLLDTQPETLGNMEDAPLVVGRTFEDPARLLSITTLAKGSSGGDPYLDIQIRFAPVSLDQALDLANALWNTGGAQPWIGQTLSTHDGVAAAASGAINHKQESFIETTVNGPGTLRFWWKVSSEESYDFLSFLVDGIVADSISGERGWETRSYAIPSGPHPLRWRYGKDELVAAGSDRGWLDQITFTPDGTSLSNDVPVTGLAGDQNSERTFKIAVPPNQDQLVIAISGGPGDCDLYVKYGGAAMLDQWDYRPYLSESEESVVVSQPAAGDWHILLHGYSAYSNVRLLARFGAAVPVITAQPRSLVVTGPTDLALRVEVASTTAVRYQWRRDGVNLSDGGKVRGADTPTLVLSGATRAESGAYSVRLANDVGSTESREAVLRVMVPTVMRAPVRMGDGRLRLRFGDPDGVGLTETAGFQVYASSDLVNWEILDAALVVRDGFIELLDPLAAYLPQRFYRTVER